MIYWGHPARKGVRACITIIYRRWPAGPADRVKDRREPRALEDDKACVGRELVGVQSNSERVVSRWKTCRQKYPRCHIPEIHQVTAIVSGRRPIEEPPCFQVGTILTSALPLTASVMFTATRLRPRHSKNIVLQGWLRTSELPWFFPASSSAFHFHIHRHAVQL